MEFSQVITFLTLILTVTPSTVSSPSSNSETVSNLGFRADLTHIDASKDLTNTELVQRAIQRSKTRAANLASRVGFGPVSVHPIVGEYALDLAIGTPPFYVAGLLDTGSELIWVQSKYCIECLPQPTPLFDPSGSSSLSIMPCSDKRCLAVDHECGPSSCVYNYSYGDSTSSIGFLAIDTFTFGSTKKVSVPKIGFGCGLFNGGDLNNASGIVGFGQGPTSLITQLGVQKFSYCFTESFQTNPTKSPAFFGSLATLTGPNVQTTPLISFMTLYFLSLKGITVGERLLPVPPETFQLQKDMSKGTLIDSGTAFLGLIKEAYGPLVEAFKSQVRLPVVNGTLVEEFNFELCFATRKPQAVRIPKLVFHLEGADWEIPTVNYMFYDKKTHLYCVMAFELDGLSILGNVLTQNMHVLYDLKNNKLSFMPTKCNQL